MLIQIIQQQGNSLQLQQLFQNYYFDSNGNASELKSLDPFISFPIGYNSLDGHWYVCVQSTGGSPNNRATLVYKIDADFNIVQNITIPNSAGITSTFDNHYGAVIDFDSSGNIYIAREKGKNSSTLVDGHNTNLLLYKTSVAGDLSTLTLLKTITGFFSYPNIWVNGSNIYLGVRGDVPSLNLDNWMIHKSTDSGSTFTSYSVFDTGLGVNGRAYVQTIHNADSDELFISFNIRNDSLGAFEAVYILRSEDGITWSNLQQNFSKNVSSSGKLTKAELDTNFLIWEKESDDYCINFEGGVFKSGILNVLISKSLIDPVIVAGNTYQTYEELRLYSYSENQALAYKNLSDIVPKWHHLWAFERTVQLCWDNNYNYIYIIDKTGSLDIVYEYRSSNNFLTYTYSILGNLTGKYYYGSHAFNSTTIDERLLILLDVQGDIDDFNSSSNLLLYKFS